MNPEIRVSILHIDAREVASGTSGTISTALDSPGAYRVEVYIRPKYLAPYLGRLGPELSEQEYPWIYANPIYLTL